MVLLNGFYSNQLVNTITLVMVITMVLFAFSHAIPDKLILTLNLILAALRWVMHLQQLYFPFTVNQLCSEDTYEQKTTAAVQSAATAADVLPASSNESSHDAKASKFNHESFQLPTDRYERNVSVSVRWYAATTITTSTTPNERQKSRAFPREINVILH